MDFCYATSEFPTKPAKEHIVICALYDGGLENEIIELVGHSKLNDQFEKEKQEKRAAEAEEEFQRMMEEDRRRDMKPQFKFGAVGLR